NSNSRFIIPEGSVLTNFDYGTGTLNGPGVFDIGNAVQFENANIVNNNATIILSTPGSSFFNYGDSGRQDALTRILTTNDGTLIVRNGRDLVLDTFVNTNLVQIESTAKIQSRSVSFTQLCGGNSCGLLRLDGGMFVADPSVNLLNQDAGTRIEGSGLLLWEPGGSGRLVNSGTVSPGTGPQAATLTLQGDYTQNAGGRLEITMTGNGVNDRFIVTWKILTDPARGGGSVSLNGTVEMQPAGGYNPAGGHTWDIMDFWSRTGAFSSVTGSGGPYMSPTYSNPNPPSTPGKVTVRK